MIPAKLRNRDNLIERTEEAWKPPIFNRNVTVWESCISRVRRFLDLQAASIWNDLRVLLAGCEGTVLDVGCGAQPYRSLLPNTVQYRGIDTSDALSNFGYEVPDTTYYEGECWPIESKCIDTVVATETLEHVECTQMFLAQAKRVLKPEGWILLTVPFAARWHYIPYDYWRFTPSGLKTVLSDAGFMETIVYARGNETTVACYKFMGLILLLLARKCQSDFSCWLQKLLGLFLAPLIVPLAIVGQISLRSRGGNDCLGYTVVARVGPLDADGSP